MIKKIVFLLGFFIVSVGFSQQIKEDSLNLIAKEYVCVNIKKSDSILKIVKEIAIKNNNNKTLGFAYKYMAKNRYCSSNFDKAILLFIESSMYFEKANNYNEQTKILYNISSVYRIKGALDSALYFSKKQLSLAKRIKNDTLIAYAYSGLSNIYSNKEFIDSVSVYAMKALNIAKKNNLEDIIWKMNLSLGSASQSNKDFNKALEYYLDVKVVLEKNNDLNSLTFLLNNIAGTYLGLKDFDNAIKIYKQNIDVSEQIGSKQVLSASYSGLGHVYSDLDQYTVSNSYYLQALEVTNEFGLEFIELDILSNLSNNYYQQGNFTKAINYGTEAISLAKKTGSIVKESETNYYLFSTYKKRGDFKKANTYLEKHVELEKELIESEKQSALAEFQTQYDVEKKELIAQNAIKEKKIALAESKQNRSFFIATIIIASLILLSSLFFFGRLRERKKAELVTVELRETQKRLAIEKQYRDSELKALKSQMNPHFIFNALNSIQEYIMFNKKELASDYLGKFADLIRTYLQHSDTGLISVQEEIDSLKMYLDLECLRFEDSLEYTFNVSEKINKDGLHIPTMLIQPYIENAIKHGLLHKKEGRKLNVSFLATDNKSIQCIVEDNGVGREKAKELKAKRNMLHKSFATKATQSRLELLNYRKDKKIGVEIIDLLNENQQAIGTKVILNIPTT